MGQHQVTAAPEGGPAETPGPDLAPPVPPISVSWASGCRVALRGPGPRPWGGFSSSPPGSHLLQQNPNRNHMVTSPLAVEVWGKERPGRGAVPSPVNGPDWTGGRCGRNALSLRTWCVLVSNVGKPGAGGPKRGGGSGALPSRPLRAEAWAALPSGWTWGARWPCLYRFSSGATQTQPGLGAGADGWAGGTEVAPAPSLCCPSVSWLLYPLLIWGPSGWGEPGAPCTVMEAPSPRPSPSRLQAEGPCSPFHCREEGRLEDGVAAVHLSDQCGRGGKHCPVPGVWGPPSPASRAEAFVLLSGSPPNHTDAARCPQGPTLRRRMRGNSRRPCLLYQPFTLEYERGSDADFGRRPAKSRFGKRESRSAAIVSHSHLSTNEA